MLLTCGCWQIHPVQLPAKHAGTYTGRNRSFAGSQHVELLNQRSRFRQRVSRKSQHAGLTLAAAKPQRQQDGPEKSNFFTKLIRPLRDFGLGKSSLWEGGVGLFVFAGIGEPAAALFPKCQAMLHQLELPHRHCRLCSHAYHMGKRRSAGAKGQRVPGSLPAFQCSKLGSTGCSSLLQVQIQHNCCCRQFWSSLWHVAYPLVPLSGYVCFCCLSAAIQCNFHWYCMIALLSCLLAVGQSSCEGCACIVATWLSRLITLQQRPPHTSGTCACSNPS